MLTYSVIRGEELISDGDDDGGVEGDDMYRESMKPVLVSSSNLYSDEEISVSASRPFSCPTLHCLLTTSLLNRNLYHDFGLRPF